MLTPANLNERLTKAKEILTKVGQSHVLKYVGELTPEQTASLLSQIESVDWPEVAKLVQTHVKAKPKFTLPEHVDPAPWYPNDPQVELHAKYDQALSLGRKLVRQGKVAAFTVAGGQGTRLGWAGPKGTFHSTPIRGTSLFGCMAEYIRKTQQKYHTIVPWYIMTSPVNDADTRAFFHDNAYFGLSQKNVMFFPQAMMPAIDLVNDIGKVLMDSKHSIALSPNGHGGSLKALYTSGAIKDMKARGIEHISYTQVDNPIVRVIDPLFIGLHALDECQMSSKMLPKAYPTEKLGNFCLVDGKMTVIEYSDLPDELANERKSDGSLRFLAGSIALHVLRVDFVEALNKQGDFGLPFHRAEKKVPYIDANGKRVLPTANNAVKLETFVFDALPLTDKSIIYETDRVDEFAPIKNADASGPEPSLDSPVTSKKAQTERAGRWLERMGVLVTRDVAGFVNAVIEISQTTAIEAEDLSGVDLPLEVKRGDRILL